MSIFSWFFECTKLQWLRIKKEIMKEGTIYIYNFMCFSLIILIQPKRTRTSGERNIIREFPITLCIAKKSFSDQGCKVRGLALFQPHQFFGLMFLIFAVCLFAQQGFVTSISTSLLISVIHGIAITINDAPSLPRVYYAIKQLF